MQTTRSTPAWAIDLVSVVCKDYKRAMPDKLQWYDRSRKERLYITHNEDGSRKWQFKNREFASGTTWYTGKIHISAGTSEEDQKLVLLHELAHYILMKPKKGKREGHSIKFWRLAFELYHKYGMDLEYSYGREKNYRAKATKAYDELVSKLAAA